MIHAQTSNLLPKVNLIPHGELAWKFRGQHTDRTDIPLTERSSATHKSLAAELRHLLFHDRLLICIKAREQGYSRVLCYVSIPTTADPRNAQCPFELGVGAGGGAGTR